MKAYILSIAGVVLIAAVVTVIAPNGKMGRFIKGTTRLFLLVIMIAPVIRWVGGGKPVFAERELPTDDAYLASCAQMLEKRDEAEIAAYLRDEFALTAQIDAERATSAYFPLQKISAILTLPGIIGEDERIHILTSVETALKERYGCTVEVSL